MVLYGSSKLTIRACIVGSCLKVGEFYDIAPSLVFLLSTFLLSSYQNALESEVQLP